MMKIYRVFASQILLEKPRKSHVLVEKHPNFPPAAGTGRLKWVDDLSGENPTCFETTSGRLKWVDDLSVKPLYSSSQPQKHKFQTLQQSFSVPQGAQRNCTKQSCVCTCLQSLPLCWVAVRSFGKVQSTLR